MSAIDYSLAEVNTQQTTTTSASYVDISGAAISSASFTTGKKYWVVVKAMGGNNTGGGHVRFQVVHGSTAFAESEMVGSATAANRTSLYMFQTVWTAVASEGVKLQFRTSGGTTMFADFISLFVMNLSDDLTENTDWYFNERATDDSLSTTPTSGGSVTFTPGTASEDWLVASYAQITHGNTSSTAISSLARSGEGTSTTPSTNRFAANSSQTYTQWLVRPFTLGAVSNTFTEQSSANTGTAHTRLHSSIFVLNLHKFYTHATAYTDADVALSATDYATVVQTVDITPPTTDVLWFGQYCFDVGHYGRLFKLRHQGYRVGDSQVDLPTGQTTAAYIVTGGQMGTAEEFPVGWIAKSATTSGNTYRSDLDASADSVSGTPTAQHRSLVAWTAELAAAAPPSAGVLARGLTKTFV